MASLRVAGASTARRRAIRLERDPRFLPYNIVKGVAMSAHKGIRWLLVLVALGLLLPAGCGKKVLSTDGMMDASAADAARRQQEEEARLKAERERQRALQEGQLAGGTGGMGAGAGAPLGAEQFINEDIFFEFDSSVLSADSQELLRRKADWMREHPMVSVIIEGHCDARGTNEYNLALGERRAQSVKSFIADLGIEGGRMRTVSYGEERPLMTGDSEEAWARNRRAHFEFSK